MDFDDSPAEAAFRNEAQAWLSNHAQMRGEEAAGNLTLFENRRARGGKGLGVRLPRMAADEI